MAGCSRTRTDRPRNISITRSGSPARRGQAGVTLIEVLVVVAVVVPIILMGAMGLFTAVTASDSTKTRQQLEAGMTSYGESLKDLAYAPCATPEQINTLYDAWPDRWQPDADSGVAASSLQVTDITYWDQASATFADTCGTDGGAQRLTIEVGDGDDTLVGTIVKRAS